MTADRRTLRGLNNRPAEGNLLVVALVGALLACGVMFLSHWLGRTEVAPMKPERATESARPGADAQPIPR